MRFHPSIHPPTQCKWPPHPRPDGIHPRTYLPECTNRPTSLTDLHIDLPLHVLFYGDVPGPGSSLNSLSSVPLGTRRPQPPSISLLSFLLVKDSSLSPLVTTDLGVSTNLFESSCFLFFVFLKIVLHFFVRIYLPRRARLVSQRCSFFRQTVPLPQCPILTSSGAVSTSHPTPCDDVFVWFFLDGNVDDRCTFCFWCWL